MVMHEEPYTIIPYVRICGGTGGAIRLPTRQEYLTRRSEATLYNGLCRPYPNAKARWYFLSWILRDAPAQRLSPLVKHVPGSSALERKTYLLNELRKFTIPLFPSQENWEWPALSEILLARLEGSRRALKGNLFETIVRRNLSTLE